MNKYGNRKIVVNGKCFDSKKEARRFVNLSLLEKAGKIKNLQCQVAFPLVPAQYEECDEVYTRGIHKGEKKRGKLLERAVTYVADFVYETADGIKVVEDTKGMKTKDYILKRKLMLYFHNIRIREV